MDGEIPASIVRSSLSIVGISSFQHPGIPKLKYAAQDARDFREYLVKEAHFAPDHVRLLVDDKATRRRVMSEMGTRFLARVARPDDLVVVFFSTHGSPSQLDPRGKNYLVTYDTDADDLFATGVEMQEILDAVRAMNVVQSKQSHRRQHQNSVTRAKITAIHRREKLDDDDHGPSRLCRFAFRGWQPQPTAIEAWSSG